MITVQRKVLKTVKCKGWPLQCMKKALVILSIFASQDFTIHSTRKGAEWILNPQQVKMSFTKYAISITKMTFKKNQYMINKHSVTSPKKMGYIYYAILPCCFQF